jgi:hypothetical protein
LKPTFSENPRGTTQGPFQELTSMDNKHQALNSTKQIGGPTHTEGSEKDGRILPMEKKT